MIRDTVFLEHSLQPFTELLAPADVTEVVVNRPGEAGVERRGGWEWHDVPDLTLERLMTLATAAAAFSMQDVNDSNPIVSTILPRGERCQIVVPPAVPEGTVSVTIRKPSTRDFGIEDLGAAGLFDETKTPSSQLSPLDVELMALRDRSDWMAFLTKAVIARKNILISGATGSGKTTLSKALIKLIPEHERLLTIEDTRELVVPHRNCVHMIYSKDEQGRSRAGAKQLLESALRMRPDRILLQELRDGTAFYYLRNVNSGHPGSITTVHADSAALAFEQLTLLVKESEGGRDLSRVDIRSLLEVLVDVVVQMKKVDGIFRVTEVYFEPVRERHPTH